MEHERGREIERASEEHRMYVTETRQVLENGVWENGERMPQNSRRTVMGYLEKPWLNRSDNWKAVMAEVRYESALVFMEESGRSNVYGSESYKVMKLTMSGGHDGWYNYQLHHREGEGSLRLYREDRDGLHYMRDETLVMCYVRVWIWSSWNACACCGWLSSDRVLQPKVIQVVLSNKSKGHLTRVPTLSSNGAHIRHRSQRPTRGLTSADGYLALRGARCGRPPR